MAMAMFIVASLVALTVVIALLVYTAPPPGPCYPPGGGQSIGCPASQLTPNDLFVTLALVIVAMGLFVLGMMVTTVAWLRPDSGP